MHVVHETHTHMHTHWSISAKGIMAIFKARKVSHKKRVCYYQEQR